MKRYQLKIQKNPKNTILILDGKYLAYRVRYSKTVELSYRNVKTGILYGFLNSVRNLLKKFNPDNVVIAWDTPYGESVRRSQFSGYKSKKRERTEQEKKEDEEFKIGYIDLIDICDQLGFISYSFEGYEADDAIALFCNQFSEDAITIITRDEDMYQCLTQNVSMYSPDDKIVKTENWFEKKYHIKTTQWAEIKATGGCKSDTIPGVPRVGEITAIKYIRYHAKILEEKITPFKKEIELYRKLVTLPHADLLNKSLKYEQTKLDRNEFITICQKFGFNSLLDNLIEFDPLFY